jgi:redox-sensitive bicupin YhaK (pirin superfamily)
MRSIDRVITTPPPTPGFIGEGHTVVVVVDPNDFARNDPFIALMDDRIDLAPGRTAGEAHPHAGFETVTFVVEGTLRDRDEGTLDAGDVLWMTAGSGVIHNEHVMPLGKSRILQLWLTLPSEHRWTPPRFERIARGAAPVRREKGVEARVYSGSSGSARATTHNFVPVTLLDVRLERGATLEQQLPASYNGFIYVLDGDVRAGAQETPLNAGQVGWLAPSDEGEGDPPLRITGEEASRFVLYAGERQNVPIVMHGPFVGETRADLMRVSRDYMEGRMPRMSELANTVTG